MKSPRINIGGIRRAQIVEAAIAVIAERGLQHLSLSEIESKVGMSRGQLTYYFKTKEDIFLAVFDRLLELMCERHEKAPADGGPPLEERSWRELVEQILRVVLHRPPINPEFHALQYTFLSQISHRGDFRAKLAELYEDWRSRMADHLRKDLRGRPAVRPISARALATVIQAIFHGLAMQTAADPDAFDPEEIMKLCLDLLSSYLWQRSAPTKKTRRTTKNTKTNGTARRLPRALANGVQHGRKQR
jgi:AcrR family transcriptional regulator